MRVTAGVSREGAPAPVLEAIELGAPRAGEALVRIVAAGICHTDLHAHDGIGLPTPRPIVLGHEGAGVVEAVGEGVTHLRPGDSVVMSGASCGACPSCLTQYPSYCREVMPRNFSGARMDGSSALAQNGELLHGHFFGQSSFATHAIADAKGAVPVSGDAPLDILAPLGCGGVTGAGAVLHSFELRPGQSIAIFGAGGVGLSAVMAARIAGASAIIAIDPVAERRALAEELGATHSVDPASDDVVGKVRDAVSGGVDFVFNTTTIAAVFDDALRMLAMRGTLGFVSAPRGGWSPDMMAMLSGGRRLVGILGGDAAPRVVIPRLVDFWRQDRFPIERMIRRYPFAEIGAAFADMRQTAAIKPVLIMEP